MSDLNIKELKIEKARNLNACFDITLKRDGTLIYFIDGKLFSPRCERSERFKHILKILNAFNFPNCYGEMYIDKPNANVFDVSKKENWANACFMPIDLIDSENNPKIFKMNYEERQNLLTKLIQELNNPFITKLIRFNNVNEGWDYVLKNNSEGLVLRNNYEWFKIKILKEAKIEIKNHEQGSNKGTFILDNDNRISGTSTQFVIQYLDIKERGKKAIAEIEYAFITKGNKFFQPRLRLIREE